MVKRSFGRRYLEFAGPTADVKLALHERRALAKDAGVFPGGTGSHRTVIGCGAVGFHRPGRVQAGYHVRLRPTRIYCSARRVQAPSQASARVFMVRRDVSRQERDQRQTNP